RLDQLVLLIAELLPKIPDIYLDVVRVAEEVVAPNLVEDSVAWQHLVGVHHQQPQEVELTGRELDRAPRAVYLATTFVHDDVLDLQFRASARLPPAHHLPNPRQPLPEVKRLAQVVVRADL